MPKPASKRRQHRQSSKPKTKKTGLKKWFDEEWIDVKTGKKCGRSGKEKKVVLTLPAGLKQSFKR